jgi:hypothetical protein
MSAQFLEAQPKPIVIYRSVNRDGETYALESRSLQRLREALGSALHAHPRIFIAHAICVDDEPPRSANVGPVIQLLTGLTEQLLRPIGDVIFLDSVTEQEFLRAPKR